MIRITERQKEINKEKASRTRELHKLFVDIFDERKDDDGYVKCFETGARMSENTYKRNTCIYSHCFDKATYPEYAMERWNILLVTPDVHNRWGANPDKTPKMKKYFHMLKEGLSIKDYLDEEIERYTTSQYTIPTHIVMNNEDFETMSFLFTKKKGKYYYGSSMIVRSEDIERNNFLVQ